MVNGPGPTPRPARQTPRRPAVGGAELAAAALTAVWVGGAALAFLGGWADRAPGLGLALGLLSTLVPVALIWIAAAAVRTARALRAEVERLQAALDTMRKAYVDQVQSAGTVRPQAAPDPPSGRDPGAAPRFAAAPRPAPPPEAEPLLALAPVEAPPEHLSRADFIRAIDFPATTADREGFRALARAQRHRQAAALIRASQDVLTLLSEDGIYMDDLSPDRARPELWRRFAQGDRGRAIGDLGGVREHSALALTAARMRHDTIFRDTAHHFLRRFDRTFTEFEAEASDAEIAAFADTRTARAFMLLARVAGTFD